MTSALQTLGQKITSCNACPRLRRYCEGVAATKRRAYANEEYWGKPITGFGDPRARLMIVGLAPAAHGANRTGRIFTGDRSGEWLYRALHKAGFANQPASRHRDDDLRLKNAYVSCVVRCAPPDNKPTSRELKRCTGYLEQEIQAMPQIKIWLALGQIALTGIWPVLRESFNLSGRPHFRHGAQVQLNDDRWLLMSYHPSQQNTFTGRLTEPMFDAVFAEAAGILRKF